MIGEQSGNRLPSHKQFSRVARKALALTAIATMYGGGMVHANERVDIEQRAVAGNTRQLKDLPGFAKHVTKNQFTLLKESTVKIYSSNTTADGKILTRSCTGNKLNLGGVDYVSTAAHCFVGDLSLANAGLLGPRQGNRKALDFMNVLNSNVAIRDMNQIASSSPVSISEYTMPQKMALPSGISLGLRRDDDALMGVVPSVVDTEGDSSRSFHEISALAYEPAIQRPVLGQQVAIYGAPWPDNIGIGAVGRYIGRMNYSPIRDQDLDIVAIKPSDIEHNPCQSGASGPAAITADGQTLGGLSFGFGLGYGKNTQNAVPLPDDADLYPPGYPAVSWLRIEDSLGVDIPPAFNNICMFGVRDEHSMPNLIGGLGVYAASTIR